MDECYWSIMGDKPPKLDEKTALYVDLKQAVKRLPTAEPSGELISKQETIEMFHRVANIGWNHGIEMTVADAFKEAAEMVKLPTAEPRKGEWLDDCGGMACSYCGFSCDDPYYLGEANYCPNCGARMMEESDG